MEVLKAMVAQNPADAFARYGLAMELVKTGQLESGVAEFRALLDHNPNYAAAYFHGGQALEKMGDVEQARRLYEKGISGVCDVMADESIFFAFIQCLDGIIFSIETGEKCNFVSE